MRAIVVGVGTLIHLLPHAFSLTSVGALSLYAGAHGKPRVSWLVPLLPLGLALLITGGFSPLVFAFVYVGYVLSTLIGRWLLAKHRNISRFSIAVVVAAVVFYLVSNLSMLALGFFPQTFAGLIECYVAGLPLLLRAMIADALYSSVLFGIHSLLEHRSSEPLSA